MKYKLLLGTCLVSFIILCSISYAEELRNCKTMFNGTCTEYYAPIGGAAEERKCKTMQNGECLEYYRGYVRENDYIQKRTDLRKLNTPVSNKVCNNMFGFFSILDPYATNIWSLQYYNQARIFITMVLPNSPASKAGLNAGDEIKKINGIKSVKFKSINDFYNYLNNNSKVELEIKGVNGDKKSVTLKKEEICRTVQQEPLFDAYWEQICPTNSAGLDLISKVLSSIGVVSNKLTSAIKSDIAAEQRQYNEWINKRAQFRRGFDVCMANSYSEPDLNNCLNQLVNRFVSTISHEQTLNMQRQTLQTQQYMQQQKVDALNNYSRALQNQHVYHSGSVYHGVSVDGKVDVNMNGTLYHRY